MKNKVSKNNEDMGRANASPIFCALQKKMRLSRLIFLVIGILLSWYVTWPMNPALTIKDGKSNQLVFLHVLHPGERFSIEFIHSIHQTPVLEEYYIDERLVIVLDQVTYESYGVGNPSSLEDGQTFRQIDGKYIIGNMNRKLPFFDLAIGQVIGDPQLFIGGKKFPFSKINPPGSWVRIQMKRVSLVDIWRGGIVFGR